MAKQSKQEDGTPAIGPALVTVVDKETGLEHELPQRVLDELGSAGKKQFTKQVDKPADLQ